MRKINLANCNIIFQAYTDTIEQQQQQQQQQQQRNVKWCKTQLIRIKSSDTSSMWFMCPAAHGSCAIAVPSARLPPINILLIGYFHEKQVVAERNKNKSYSFAVV